MRDLQINVDFILSMILDVQTQMGKMLFMHCMFQKLRFRAANPGVMFTRHLVSLWREFQRACNTSKRASGSQVGSSFTMTLRRWMQSNWAASWLLGTGGLDSPGPLNIATCQGKGTKQLGISANLHESRTCFDGVHEQCRMQGVDLQQHSRARLDCLIACCSVESIAENALLETAALHTIQTKIARQGCTRLLCCIHKGAAQCVYSGLHACLIPASDLRVCL